MKLRFKIQDVIDAGLPNNFCGVTPTDFSSYTDMGLVLKLNNIDVINVADLNAYSSSTADVVDDKGNQLAITASMTGLYITVNIPLEQTWDSVTMSIDITHSGYHSYSNDNIKLYGYDLGNDLSITHNTDFNFIIFRPANTITVYPTLFYNIYLNWDFENYPRIILKKYQLL